MRFKSTSDFEGFHATESKIISFENQTPAALNLYPNLHPSVTSFRSGILIVIVAAIQPRRTLT